MHHELVSFLDDENCVYRRRNISRQVTTPDIDTVQGSCFLCSPYQRCVYVHVRAICFLFYAPTVLRALCVFCCVLCYRQRHSHDFRPRVLTSRSRNCHWDVTRGTICKLHIPQSSRLC